jgi:hypothetical protein
MSSKILSEIVLALVLVAQAARADDEALKAQRERFRAGMAKYEAGAYADAIVVWEQVYREIGEVTGYKLAFNLGRAYDRYGDSTRAAERYEAFVRQVAQRREGGDNLTLEPEIEKWEAEAKERLDQLAATKGRIKVTTGDRPTAVRVDASEPRLAGFTAYVEPGHHTLTFGEGKEAQKVDVSVTEGAQVEVSPPPVNVHVNVPMPVPEKPERPEPKWETRTEHPFSPSVLYATGGAALLSTLVPIVTYSNALSIRDDYEASNDKRAPNAAQLGSDYDSARSTAYATLAIPIGLAVITAGLAAWYFFGTKETRVMVGRF